MEISATIVKDSTTEAGKRIRRIHPTPTAGDTYSRWTVVSEAPKRGVRRYYNVVCICGTNKEVIGQNLTSGESKSCGCLFKDETKHLVTKHGMWKTKVYQCWVDMLTRCNNPKNKRYKDYGARGIGVTSEWLDFSNFYSDMGDPPAGHSLDRRDNNLGYDKSNCKWSTPKEQANNRRTNRLVSLNGTSMTMMQASEQSGINYSTLKNNLNTKGVYEQRS